MFAMARGSVTTSGGFSDPVQRVALNFQM